MEDFVRGMVILISGITFSILLLCLTVSVINETIKSLNKQVEEKSDMPKTPKPPAPKQ